jgi:hypothetical protein
MASEGSVFIFDPLSPVSPSFGPVGENRGFVFLGLQQAWLGVSRVSGDF